LAVPGKPKSPAVAGGIGQEAIRTQHEALMRGEAFGQGECGAVMGEQDVRIAREVARRHFGRGAHEDGEGGLAALADGRQQAAEIRARQHGGHGEADLAHHLELVATDFGPRFEQAFDRSARAFAELLARFSQADGLGALDDQRGAHPMLQRLDAPRKGSL